MRHLATGAIEIRANSVRILSESETPPFPIEENSKTKEELRLKYRFLDLRRPDIQKNLMIRSRVATLTRAVCILVPSTPCPSHRSCSSSFSCVPVMTAISSWPAATVTRT